MEQVTAELASVRQRLSLSEQHNVQMAENMEKMRKEMDESMRNAYAKLNYLEQQKGHKDEKEDKMDLIDVRTMNPGVFTGKMNESYKLWAKKVKAFTNARKPGFRQALDWAELETNPIDMDAIKSMNWAPAEIASSKLYDMLIMHLSDDPLILVENHLNQGFEAWRALSRRYDPVGEQFTFDRMTSLLTRERCKNIGELPAAIEKWNRDLSLYERKTGKTLEKEWRVPIIFQMVPAANMSEIKARWQLNAKKDITDFAQELIIYANDLSHEQRRGRGPAAMDVDNLGRGQGQGQGQGEEDYTEAEWDDYVAECQATLDWVGKGGGKGKGGKGRKGKGKGKGNGCFWCGKEGHTKANCKEFEKFKKDKDEERKKKGLPPFKPRGVAALEPSQSGNGDYEDVLPEGGVGMLDVGCDSLVVCQEECGCCMVVPSEENTNLKLSGSGAGDVGDDDWESVDDDASDVDCDMMGIEDDFSLDVIGTTTPTGDSHYEDPGAWLRAQHTFKGARGATETDSQVQQPGIGMQNMFKALGEDRKDVNETFAEKMYREQQELIREFSGETGEIPPKPRQRLIPIRESPAETPITISPDVSHKLGKSSRPLLQIAPPPEVPVGLERPSRRRGNRFARVAFQKECDDRECGEGCGPCKHPPGGLPETQESSSQTEVQLDHSIRSITWFPMADDLEPFHEIADEEEELAPACKAETAEIGDVNDVDMLEIRQDDAAEGIESLDAPKPPTPGPEIITALMYMIFCTTQAGPAKEIDNEDTETGMDSQEENVTDSDEDVTPEESENPDNVEYDLDEKFEDLEKFLEDPEEEFEDLENFLNNYGEEFEELENFLESYIPDADANNYIDYTDDADRVLDSENHEVYSSDIEIKKKNKEIRNPEVGIRKYVEVYSLGSENTPSAQTKSQAAKGAKMKLRQGITMDSGSHHNVMPRRLVKENRIRQSAFSRRGVHYIAANKGKIPNEGETSFEFETTDGDPECWDFQIAEVNKALGSIADRVDNNNRVVFDKDMLKNKDVSYIFNKTTRRMIKMVREGNVWKVEALVSAENVRDAGFAGRG